MQASGIWLAHRAGEKDKLVKYTNLYKHLTLALL